MDRETSASPLIVFLLQAIDVGGEWEGRIRAIKAEWLYELNVVSSQNSYVEPLISNVMVFGVGVFGGN